MKLDESYVKKYFKRKGTVSKWWDPESITLNWFKTLLSDQENILRKISPKGRIILDAGTGRGRFASNFALAGVKRVIALDLSEEMIKIAREKAENFGMEIRWNSCKGT